MNILFISKACSKPWFVKNLNEIVDKSISIFGQESILWYISSTAGKVFSGGSTDLEMSIALKLLNQRQFGAIADYCAEGVDND